MSLLPPSLDEESSILKMSLGNYNMKKLTTSFNVPISDSVATSFSFSGHKRDEAILLTILCNKNLTMLTTFMRNDWYFNCLITSSLRFLLNITTWTEMFPPMKGIDDLTPHPRELDQDAPSNAGLTSSIYAAIFEQDLGFANLKMLASSQRDDITVRRDNDRHSMEPLQRLFSYLPCEEFTFHQNIDMNLL